MRNMRANTSSPKKKSATAKAKKTVSLAPVVPIEGELIALPRKKGQQSAYTEALAQEILERMSDGESLNAICQSAHMPHERAVRRWKRDDVHGFNERFEDARDLLLEKWADEVISIADEPTADIAAVQRNRNRMDSRKWILSKLKPERYGDRLDMTVVNKTEKISDDNLEAQLKALLAGKKTAEQSALETIHDDKPKPKLITQRPEQLAIAKPKPKPVEHCGYGYGNEDDEDDLPSRSVRLIRQG
jgi:hypothetical protein